MKDKLIDALPHIALHMMYVAVVILIGGMLVGCTVNIESTGANAKFELSPARNIYPNTSVMNGLSLIPSGGDSEKADKNDEEASKPDNQ